jgi:hypothetical protein
MSDSGYSSSSTHGFESASELNSQSSSVSSPSAMKRASKGMLDNMDDRAGLVESPLDIHHQQAHTEFATGLSPVHSAASSTVKGSPDPSLVDVTKRDRRSKTWRGSFIRLPLSRLRTSEVADGSGAESDAPAKTEKPKKAPKPEKAEKPAKAQKMEKVKPEKPAKPEKVKPKKAEPEKPAKPEKTEKPEQADKTNANKKLQKKRPASMVKVMSFDSSLQDAIPRIPPDMRQRLEERAGEQVGTTGVTGIQFVENQQAKTTLAVDAANIDHAINPLASAHYYNPEAMQSMLPAAAPAVPSGPSRERPAPRPAPIQRRLSLTRLSQNLKAKATGKDAPREQPKPRYHLDEEVEERHYPHEFASIGSASQSLGSSAYELGAMAQRALPNGHGPAPGAGQKRLTFLPWNGPPGVPYVRATRVERPSLFHGRHRPKSFNGHGRATMEALGEVDEAGAGVADAEYQSEHERRVELPAPSGDADAMAVAVIVPTPVELEAPTKMKKEEAAVPVVALASAQPIAQTTPAAESTTARPVTPTARKAAVPELPATPVDPPTITIAGPSPETRAPEKRFADSPPDELRRPQIHPTASHPSTAPRRSASTTAVPPAPTAPADWTAAREQWSDRRARAAAAAAPTAKELKKERKREEKRLRPSRSSSLRARLGLRAARSQPELRVAAPNWVIDEAYDEDELAEAPPEGEEGLYPRSLEAPIAAVPPVPAGAWARAWAAAEPAAASVAAVPAVAVSGEAVAVAAA